MFIVLVGIGRTGRRFVELASRDRQEIVIIDRNPDRAKAASQDFDCIVINDNAASQETLEQAGVDRADALITTTPDDAVNLMIMMLGRKLGARQLLTSVSNPSHIKLFQDLGIHIVESPHRLNGQFFYRAVQRPSVLDFLDLGGGAEIFELLLTADAPLAGLTLEESGRTGILPDETVVVAVRRGNDLIVPRGQTRLLAGDLVTIFSRYGATRKSILAFTGRHA